MNREILRENRIHGNKIFPFGIYPMNRISQQNQLEHHWHDELEILFVTEGCADFQVNTVHYTVACGEAIFINSGIIHAGSLGKQEGCTYCAMVFSVDLLVGNDFDILRTKYIDPIVKGRFGLPVHIMGGIPWEDSVLEHIREAISAGISGNFTYELLIKAHLYSIFSLVLANGLLGEYQSEPAVDSLKTGKVKEILNYIRENYSRKLTIGELALKLNMSEGHFCRFFKQMLYKTPVDYINDYRIFMAARMLADSSKKVIGVAMDVGFENCSYFINLFKSRMGCTPSEYRKRRQQ